MKSEIFNTAIANRQKIKFVYNHSSVEVEPYYVSVNKNGNKVIYGRPNSSQEIRMFEYNKIFNIKVLSNSRFSPIIPILPIYN